MKYLASLGSSEKFSDEVSGENSGDAQKSQKTKVGFVGFPKIHLISQEDLVWLEILSF